MSNLNQLKGSDAAPQPSVDEKHIAAVDEVDQTTNVLFDDSAAGVAKTKALQTVWGKSGKRILWSGLALMLTIYALDYSTVYIYQTLATSAFEQLSAVAGIQTSVTIVSAVAKPPIAKLSDVLGRGETYLLIAAIYTLSFIMGAISSSIRVYAVSTIFYAVGNSGIQILNQVIIADFSTTRWRGFAIGSSYFPGLITPWVSGFIIESVTDGIGWKWGIGMFAIMIPVCSVFVIGPLLYYSRKAKIAGLILTERMSLYKFCSLIDLGGVVLLCGGFAMLLLPIALSATTPSKWQTPWVDAVLALGIVFLISLVPYEHFIATHPVLPLRYFREMAIVSSCLLGFLDALGYSVTHTYLFTWAVVVHNYSPRVATFLLNTNAALQLFSGLLTGLLMAKTRRYKWIFWIGVSIRLVGYGVMMRVRGADNSTAELFVVQVIQGVGSGMIETIIVVSAQIVVSHAELAQISSLVLLCIFLGVAVGQAIAGSIYTNNFPTELHKHLPNASADTISTLINSIFDVLPDWGTVERSGINAAYSDVIRQMTLVALVISVPTFVCVLLMPDNRLVDAHNLLEAEGTKEVQGGSNNEDSKQ